MTDARKGDVTCVAYVAGKNAKGVKNYLEKHNLIDKKFRITKAAVGICEISCVAVPLLPSCTKNALVDLPIEGFGEQFCGYSSAVLGNHGGRADSKMSLVQQALFNTAKMHPEAINEEALMQRILELPGTICPNSIEIFGDDSCLILSPRILNPTHEGPFAELLHEVDKIEADENHATFMLQLWKELARLYNSPRIFRRSTIDADSPVRASTFTLLWPVFPPETATSQQLGINNSPTWITVTEHGIAQSFDITKVMFSRGNITEKIRFGRLVQRDEVVLDLYAGIGYFTLPALVHGKAKHVYACEWNPDAIDALQVNLEANRVQDRVTVLQGDCRVLARMENLVDKVDRVSLGLLPSSEGGWKTAYRALFHDKGGWLHIHGNVPLHEQKVWSQWLCLCFAEMIKESGRNWCALLTHVEKVKSFAPSIYHLVADIVLGPCARIETAFPTKDGTTLRSAEAGLLREDGSIEIICPGFVEPPSCALSPDGALHQSWMREPSE